MPRSTDPIEVLGHTILEKRPLVLVTGQSFDSAHDAIRDALLARLECTKEPDPGWRVLLDKGMRADDMGWLAERFDRCVPSDAAAAIFEVPWSAVFTSSIDPRFARRFETRGRQPETVLSRDVHTRVPRSRSRPPVHYLLGKCDETVEEARAPLGHSDLTRRLVRHATELLNRIPETATAAGLVVVAGYEPDRDWLPLDNFLSPFSGVGPTILWFGQAHGVQESDIAREILAQGSLVTTPTSLATALSWLELRGVLDVAGSAAPDDPGLVSMTGDAVLNITPDLRLRVEASAAIVDDGWTEDPEPMGESEQYEEFRRFHGSPANFRLLVEGVSRGFAFEREFERTLWKTLRATLQGFGKSDSDSTLILHGQSGTGKTIALARLTQRIRRELGLPVLVASRRIPYHADIETFCQESERLGSAATVLICDANQMPARYDDLASALRSRGRRLLIVGSCYRLETPATREHRRFVEAPAEVSGSELSDFRALRETFHLEPSYDSETSHAIFAMLYRTLPMARGKLAAGVSSEARATEGLVRDRAQHVPQPAVGLSDLARQLMELGILTHTTPLFEHDERLALLGSDGAARLIEYVMVTGRLDRPVPVNLVLRALGHGGGLRQEQLIHLFRDLDLFRWQADEEGSDYLIAPRIQLEARLICQRRLTTEQEIERLLDLVGCVRLGVDQNTERSFLLDLLYRVDRDGPCGETYRTGYLRFADALEQLRQHHKIWDPDVILRECVFRRRAVFHLQTQLEADQPNRQQITILDDARRTIEEAFRQIDDPARHVSRKTRQSLVAERAAIYGYLAVQRAKAGVEANYWADYLAARAASDKAIGQGRNAHPIDIALWTVGDIFQAKRNQLSNLQRAEVLADFYTTLEVADGVFGVTEPTAEKPDNLRSDSESDDGVAVLYQKERYLKRRAEVASIIGDTQLSDATLAELDSIAPAAATYLIARRRAEPFYHAKPPFDDHTRGIAGSAADYITERLNTGTELDDRCLRLLLRLRWAQATGERLMFTQRGRTPADSDPTRRMFQIVEGLNEQAGTDARDRERFLEAVLCWLLRDTKRAMGIWRSLSNDTEYEDRSRVVRWLIETDESGSFRRFRGRVEKHGESYQVRVEGIDGRIRVLARDFPNETLTHGRELQNFGIAFNYIGPCADPLSRPVGRR